jgi:uncharacterized membrane protein YqjE
MDENLPPLIAEASDPALQDSLIGDVRQLALDARTLAQAELAYQTSRAKTAGSGIGKIAGLGVLALVLVYFALMALVFGAVLALAPVLTAWGATGAVMLVLVLLAVICLLLARSRWKRLSTLLSDKKDAA